ncbi:MAG: hypothetical protein EXR13_02540 [Candidatus Fonsibacter sp.]|nr:hypothetical protein [Candidatus Fonsibacter sp.]
MKQDYSVKDILNAVDDILKIKSAQDPIKKIINEAAVKTLNSKRLNNNPESKKENEIRKKYDLLVVDNAKDILILNRIIFK